MSEFEAIGRQGDLHRFNVHPHVQITVLTKGPFHSVSHPQLRFSYLSPVYLRLDLAAHGAPSSSY